MPIGACDPRAPEPEGGHCRDTRADQPDDPAWRPAGQALLPPGKLPQEEGAQSSLTTSM